MNEFAAEQPRSVMTAGLRRVVSVAASTVGLGLLCLVLASCAREGRRFYSSEPSVVPTINVFSYEDLNRLAGFNVVTPSYLPNGLSSEPEFSYIPDLKEAELVYYADGTSGSRTGIAVRVSEALDPGRRHCPPCPETISDYDTKTVSGQQVLLSRSPSKDARSPILAYFWLNEVFVTLVIDRADSAATAPNVDVLEAEILRIATSIIGKPS